MEVAAQQKSKQEVAKKPESNLPAEMDYSQHAGEGFEGITGADLTIPRLVILQSNSPQVDSDHAKYLKGAKQGMIMNTVTNELFDGDKGIVVVPCTRNHMYVEWIPRDDGGGFVGQHDPAEPVVSDAKNNSGSAIGRLALKNGNELVETFYVWGLRVTDDKRIEQALIAFSSTQIKKYKAWITVAATQQMQNGSGKKYQAPLFAFQYRLTTVREENKKGKFYGWKINFRGENAAASLVKDKSIMEAAVALKDMVSAGAARADYSDATREDATGDDSI
jgi:hypothetical protein